MNPTAFDHIRDLINRVNAQIEILNTLLETDRPQFVQRIVYIGAKFYLQALLFELEQIAWELALQEIQEIIGNDIFTGLNSSNQPYSWETMASIRDELLTCEPDNLVCFASLEISEIEEALNARFAAIADVLLPLPPNYAFGQDNTDGTFDFEIQTTSGTQTVTGRITQVNNGGAVDDTYIWLPTTIFGGFTNNPVGNEELAETRLLQAKYGYVALRAAWDFYQVSIPLDIKMLLAIYYRGELGTDSTNDIRLEALARTFFDQQSGGCRNGLNCNTFENMAEVLAASEFWYNRTETVDSNGNTTAFGAFARVRIDGAINGRGLLNEAHIGTLQQDAQADVGPFAVDGHIASIFTEHLDWLKFPGQSATNPSRWANFTLLPSERDALLDNKTEVEQFQALQTHLRNMINPPNNNIALFEWSITIETASCVEFFVVVNAEPIVLISTCA